jgi:hypothetical protein
MFSLGFKKKIIKPIPDLLRKKAERTILFTNVRDEKNMKEWVAHHLLLGFELIYIFDHKSNPPLLAELFKFDKRVVIERCNLNTSIKMQLMTKAARIATDAGSDWMCYLDADEFIVLNQFNNIKQMLISYHYADLLAINWLMFGTNHLIEEPKSGLLIENYTKSDIILNKHVKSFVRPSQVVSATNPHFYNIANSYKMISLNNQILNKAEPCFHEWNIEYYKAPAFIAHYIYQSEQTYIERKINLPRDDTNSFRSIDKQIHEKHNETDNLMVKNKYSEKINTFLQIKKQILSQKNNSNTIQEINMEPTTQMLFK